MEVDVSVSANERVCEEIFKELKEFVTEGDGSNGPGYFPYLEGGRQYYCLTYWMWEPNRKPVELLYLVDELMGPFMEGINPHGAQRDYRCWFVLAVLKGLSGLYMPNTENGSIVIEGCYADIIVALAEYSRDFNSDFRFRLDMLTKHTLKNGYGFCWEWLVNAACSESICPLPYVRLELLRIIHIFSGGCLTLHDIERITGSLVGTFTCLDPDQLFILLGPDLLSLQQLVLRGFSSPWHLRNLVNTCIYDELDSNTIGEEVQYIIHTVKIIGLFVHWFRDLYKKDGKKLRQKLNKLIEFLSDFNVEFKGVLSHNIVMPYTCNVIAEITDTALTVSEHIYVLPEKDNLTKEQFSKLIRRRKGLYSNMMIKRNNLVVDLEIPQNLHKHRINVFQRELGDFKYNFNFKKSMCTISKVPLYIPEFNSINEYAIENDDSSDDDMVSQISSTEGSADGDENNVNDDDDDEINYLTPNEGSNSELEDFDDNADFDFDFRPTTPNSLNESDEIDRNSIFDSDID